jgi:hypothetical protein
MRARGRRHAGGAARPDAARAARRRSLAARCDRPVLRSLLLAPPDDEALSSEEAAKLANTWGEYQRGDVRCEGCQAAAIAGGCG